MPEELDIEKELDQSPKARMRRFIARVVNTRYTFIALLIHLLILSIFGGKIIFDAITAKGVFETPGEVLVSSPAGPPPPPPSSSSSSQSFDVKVAQSHAPVKMVNRISTANLSSTFNVPPPDISIVSDSTMEIKTDDNIRDRMAKGEMGRLNGVRGFLGDGVKGGKGVRGATGRGKTTVATFTCYVAQYAGGDWDCNFGMVADNKFYANCIFNLMLQIERWTQGRVRANLKPEALKLSSREWIEKVKPPFIFMTGHQNFILTAAEVSNLREYLMLGGALWVDNSLPGHRSRFDLALRREMKKVLPDRDFETLPNTDPVYNSYYNYGAPPPGINFYKEPIEAIKIGGVVAVFYTLNAYSDLWETELTPDGQVDEKEDFSPTLQRHIFRCGPHWTIEGERTPPYAQFPFVPHPNYVPFPKYAYFRNVTVDSIKHAYEFGVNIVIHLLTRFQDKFLTLPKEGASS